jgi:hypothetical protein
MTARKQSSRQYGKINKLTSQNPNYKNLNPHEADRNKIYSIRASVPINIPLNVFDIPGVLSNKFD